ncbi:MAG: HesA/MoeB/ThiF family protein [Acidilobaceae archaeon]|nr:HesA/MoeB/ThiF family protein [Acidilobaceae archaeon]
MSLDKIDIVRYSRQLPLLGAGGQIRLLGSRVAVVGLGGLGSLISLYLAALGVGKLILIDPDKVGLENLNRQILYSTSDIGRPKARAAAERIAALNPLVEVESYEERVTEENAEEVLEGADIIMDGLDEWRSRLVLDQYAWEKGKTLVHGAAERYYGQVTVVERGRSNCLACIAPKPPAERGCSGVVAPTVGIVASIEVMEALKVMTGIGEPAYNKLIVVDARRPAIDEIALKHMSCEECRSRIR